MKRKKKKEVGMPVTKLPNVQVPQARTSHDTTVELAGHETLDLRRQ